MIKMKSILQKAALFATCLAILSCSNILTDAKEDVSNASAEHTSGAVVSFRFSSKTILSRTALPSIDFENYLYTIKAKKNGTETEQVLAEELEITELSAKKFTLSRSIWVFSVLAFEKLSGKKVLEGDSATIDLSKGNTAKVNMVLRAAAGGVGSVKIPVNFVNKGVEKVTAILCTDPTGTTPATNSDGNAFAAKTFTKGSGITSNNEKFNLVYEENKIPSGKTYYAKISLYDKNGVCVGTYTEAVYVADGQTSEPVIYAKDENGNPKTDADGNYEKVETSDGVTVETNLFTASITADPGKTVIAVDKDNNEYVLEENEDGTYTGELPPGDYTIKVGDDEDSAEKIEDAGLNIKTNGGTSSAKIYTITYYDGTTPVTNLTYPAKYTIHKAVTLPDATKAAKTGYQFCGWYEKADFSGEPVIKIEKDSTGNKTYYARYMSLTDVTPINHVEVTGTKKVGGTLTAKAYTSADGSKEFTGELKPVTWYLGTDSNSDGNITGEEWVSAGTGATYKITKNDAGKVIKAEFVQKYTTSLDNEKKIYIVHTDNSAVSSFDSIANDTITKGNLNSEALEELLESLSITYEIKPVLGSELSDDQVSVTKQSLNVKENLVVKDDFENDISVSLNLPADAKAPVSSNYVPFVIKADGYNEITKSDILFVTVKASAPKTEDLVLQVEEESNPVISYGYIDFESVPENLEFSLNPNETNAQWQTLLAAEFKKPDGSPFAGGEKLYVRTKATAGTSDEKDNPVGYIAPSDNVEIAVSAANVGKRNAVKATSFELSPLSEIEVTAAMNEGTATLTITNAEAYKDITWESEAALLGTTDNLTITPVTVSAAVTCATGKPGRYGVVLTAKDKATSATYSTTVYITFGNN